MARPYKQVAVLSAANDPSELIQRLVDGFIADPEACAAAINSPKASLPAEAIVDLDEVLASSKTSYRDGVMIQLAYGVSHPVCDLTRRQPGGRSVAQQLGEFLAERHIKSVKDPIRTLQRTRMYLTAVMFRRLIDCSNGRTLST